MVKKCCVRNCDVEANGKIKCFRFPSSRIQKRQWIDVIGLSNKLSGDSLICIKHFQEEDYDIVRGRPKLRPRVIPSVFAETIKSSNSSVVLEDNASLSSELDDNVNTHSDKHSESNESENSEKSNNKSRKNTDVKEKPQNDKRKSSVPDKEKSPLKASKEPDGVRTRKSSLNDKTPKKNNDKSNKKTDDDKANKKTDNDTRKKTDSDNSIKKIDIDENDTIIDNDKGNKTINNDKTNKIGNERNETSKPETATDDSTDRCGTEKEKIDKSRKSSSPEREQIEKAGSDRSDSRSGSSRSSPQPSSSADELNEDIEDIIARYQIKQTRRVHAAEPPAQPAHTAPPPAQPAHTAPPPAQPAHTAPPPAQPAHTAPPPAQPAHTDQTAQPPRAATRYVEVAVRDKGDRSGSPRDCLMLMESVQVELDPSAFLTADGDHPDNDCHETVDLVDAPDEPPDDRPPQDPISLLTSSDEDEVIIQEPHIDTVEVSDETDEDDIPLVKLLKKAKHFTPEVWKPIKFKCKECQFKTVDPVAYQYHLIDHSKIFQVCQVCNYMTASKTQFTKHKRRHREDKRYKCHLCEFKAKHNMSLIYHLKTHKVSGAKRGRQCGKCGFKSSVKGAVSRHARLLCQVCNYMTASKTQFTKHKRRHREDKRYKCHLCEFKAKHNMSLIYHLKTHKVSGAKRGRQCGKCGFKSSVKGAVSRHARLCTYLVPEH